MMKIENLEIVKFKDGSFGVRRETPLWGRVGGLIQGYKIEKYLFLSLRSPLGNQVPNPILENSWKCVRNDGTLSNLCKGSRALVQERFLEVCVAFALINCPDVGTPVMRNSHE